MNKDADSIMEIGLAEAIGRVRAELAAAQLAGANESLKFRLGEVQLEFAVELARSGEGEAGVKLWVVNVGAKGTVTSGRSHTITVTMTPEKIGADGQWVDAQVGDAVAGRPPVGIDARTGSGIDEE
jgi:hypothetical protein